MLDMPPQNMQIMLSASVTGFHPQIERYKNMYSPSLMLMALSAPLDSAKTIHTGLSVLPLLYDYL